MRSNRLQLNTAKTEVIWCASSRRQYQIPQVPVRVGDDLVSPATSARDLGIHLDADATMSSHVAKAVSSCFSVLRQLRNIRRSVTNPVLQSLVVSLVLTRLDYGNASLADLFSTLLDRLQSVLNAAARLIFSARKHDHISPLLNDLHWLWVPQRTEFKLAVLVYLCLHSTAPSYLADELCRVPDIPARQRLRSASTAALDVLVTRCSTMGDRSFSVAAARVWNSLPAVVTSAPSLLAFRQMLKTELICCSFSDN